MKNKIELALENNKTALLIYTKEEDLLQEKIEEAVSDLYDDFLKAPDDSVYVSLTKWDLGGGFQRLHSMEQYSLQIEDGAAVNNPIAALEKIVQETQKDTENANVFYLTGLDGNFKNYIVVRQLANAIRQTRDSENLALFIIPIVSADKVPEDLIDIVTIDIEGFSTSKSDIEKITKDFGITSDKVAESLMGLRRNQAYWALQDAATIFGDAESDKSLKFLRARKKELLAETGEALYWVESKLSMNDVGGLDNLKDWIQKRKSGFTQKAKAFGIDPPKGLALIGIPGTGKSLTAKAIANQMGLPLFRLDVGALFGSLVGESERRVRQVLSKIDQLSPCVLWIDEIEKALSFGSGGGDNGTSLRVFGSILTWMQEKTSSVFVVATANDVSMIPVEMFRTGRFDALFFLDLPNTNERKRIFEIHLKKRDRDPEKFDLTKIAEETDGFVGAEIEQTVIESLYIAFDKNKEVGTQDVIDATRNIVPLYKSQKEVVKALQAMVTEGRALPASSKSNIVTKPTPSIGFGKVTTKRKIKLKRGI